MENLASDTVNLGTVGLFLVVVVATLVVGGRVNAVLSRRLAGWHDASVGVLAGFIVSVPLIAVTLALFI